MTLQALLTLFLWGYVHYTYIVSSQDCLANITERPFPHDVILQVEVYSNSSEIWYQREKSLQDLSIKIYNESVFDHNIRKKSKTGIFLHTNWIKDYCESSFFVNLTGTSFFCQLILEELFTSGEANDDRMETNSGVLENTGTVGVRDTSVSSSCPQENFYDAIGVLSESTTKHHFDHKNYLNAESARAAFYSKNYTLYDLIQFYSEY